MFLILTFTTFLRKDKSDSGCLHSVQKIVPVKKKKKARKKATCLSERNVLSPKSFYNIQKALNSRTIISVLINTLHFHKKKERKKSNLQLCYTIGKNSFEISILQFHRTHFQENLLPFN